MTVSLRRYIALIAGLLALTVWSGAVLAETGYAGIILVPLVWLALPVVFCIATPRFPILFGALANALTWFSLMVFNSRLTRVDRSLNWSSIWKESFETRWAYLIAVGFSLLVSVPVQMFRMKEQRNGKKYPL